jgi:drug/metabolite transporter (DMT)-like permease
LKAHLLLVFITFIWGATFVVIKDAVAQDATPLAFNFIRMSFAATLLAIIFRRHVAKITRPALYAGVLAGVFLWLGFEFQTTGLQLTSASKSAFITGLSVVLAPLFLALFWKRAIRIGTALGAVAATIGLYFLSVPASESTEARLAGINHGDLLTLACAVGFALHIIFLGRATERHSFAQIGFLQIAAAAVLMGITAPVFEQPHIVWSTRIVSALLITGVLGTTFAFTVQAWAQQFTSPAHTALIFSLEPVFAWVTSFLVLGERLDRRSGLGALLILAGVLMSELLGFRAPSARANRAHD